MRNHPLFWHSDFVLVLKIQLTQLGAGHFCSNCKRPPFEARLQRTQCTNYLEIQIISGNKISCIILLLFNYFYLITTVGCRKWFDQHLCWAGALKPATTMKTVFEQEFNHSTYHAFPITAINRLRVTSFCILLCVWRMNLSTAADGVSYICTVGPTIFQRKLFS